MTSPRLFPENQEYSPGPIDAEISLTDILDFLKSAYKTIAITSVAGLAISVAYLALTPKRYEAVAQLAMAKIEVVNNSSNNPFGVNIEEPTLLISRLSQPSSFPAHVLSTCGTKEGANSAGMLSKTIKLTLPRGVTNVAELKVSGKSPEAALTCAQAIFELVKATQAQIIAPYITDVKNRLDDDIERLSKARDLVAKADKSGLAIGPIYLSTRDEIQFLLKEIAALKSVVASNQNGVTRLIAPIYAKETPFIPKNVALAAGVFGGLILGLLLTLAHQMWIKLKGGAKVRGRGVC